jgi:hypothetical protein
MKRLIYALLMVLCISSVCLAEDYIKLGIESVPANTTVDIPFLIKRECPEPALIKGASNGFEVISTGTITWTWQDADQYPESSVDWDLGGFQVHSEFDGVSPDYFFTGGAAIGAGMPVIAEDEPYFWVRLDIGTGDGEICIDSSFVEPSATWRWVNLTCGEGGDPDRPLFVDHNGSDTYHPICLTVEHVCTPPTITGTPPGDELTTSQCSSITWTFNADPGDLDGIPATPLTWDVVSGPGAFSVPGEYSCGPLAPGTHQVEIQVENTCGGTDVYTFDVVSEDMDQQITNCTEAPPKIAGGEAYDFQFTTNEPCDPDQHFEITYYNPFIVHPPTIDDAGNFHWLTDASEAMPPPFTFEIRVLDASSYQTCEFSVRVVEAPDFYLKDCASDDGYPESSGCDPFWDFYYEHGIGNMPPPHGRKLLLGNWNTLVTTLRNRGGEGDESELDNTARVFAYWIECSSNLKWPMGNERRIINDPSHGYDSEAPTNYIQEVVKPWDTHKIYWEWLAPAIGEVVPGTHHLCIGFVINPASEPEGLTSPTFDYDNTDGRFHSVDRNNIAQINLEPITRSGGGPKGTKSTEELSVPVWNFSDEPITVIPQVDIITLGDGWSVDMDQTDSLYVPADTCVFVDLAVNIPGQAPDNDSSIIDFKVIDSEQYETVGGVRFEIRIDNDAPKPVSTLEALCADHDPNCCFWLPPEICLAMGTKAPLQWEIPDYDVENESERVWFFILCRSGSPDVGLGDQIDSVAADFSRDDPGFQWIDADIELGETYYYCVYVVDEAGNMSEKSNVVQFNAYVCGDCDGSGGVDIDDVICLIGIIFGGDPLPDPPELGDVTCDGILDIDDVVYLLSWIFMGGPPPCAPCNGPLTSGKSVSGSAEVNLSQELEDEAGSVSVSVVSDVEIQGAQLEFSVEGTVDEIEATSMVEGIEVFQGRVGDEFRVGLVDLEGQQMIPSSNTEVLLIEYSGKGRLTLEDQILAARGGGKVQLAPQKQTGPDILPSELTLQQNYPNPFNPSTEIMFSLPEESDVVLDIYNILGQRVTTLLDTHLPAGSHSVTWNGRCDDGSTAASGMYFYRIEAKDYQESKKMLLLK